MHASPMPLPRVGFRQVAESGIATIRRGAALTGICAGSPALTAAHGRVFPNMPPAGKDRQAGTVWQRSTRCRNCRIRDLAGDPGERIAEPTPGPGDGGPSPCLRCDVYAVLAGLLTWPPATGEIPGLLQAAVPGTPAALEQALLEIMAARAEAGDGSVEREYADLFAGPDPGRLLAHAAYYDESRRSGLPLARLRGHLAVLNLRRPPGAGLREDHAGALCDAMMLIISGAAGTSRHETVFFNSHLSPWLPRFFRDLQASPAAVFYRPVGRLGEVFMMMEKELLQKFRRPDPG